MKYVIELGKCIAVRGTVVRTSNVKPLVTRMAFKCASCSGTQVCSCIAMCSIKLLYMRIIYILYVYACVVYTYTYVRICCSYTYVYKLMYTVRVCIYVYICYVCIIYSKRKFRIIIPTSPSCMIKYVRMM